MFCAGSLLIVGCGGDDGPGASCGKVQPCGGNVVGEWEVVAGCVDGPAFAREVAMQVMGGDCPTETVRGINLGASGSFQFNSDLTYSLSITRAGSVDLNIPASCLAGGNCATLTANLQAAIAAGTRPGVVSVACSGASDCVCHQVLSIPGSTAGTYTTAGNVLTTIVETTGASSTTDYCIDGITGHFMAVSTGPTGQVTVDSDIVGVRR